MTADVNTYKFTAGFDQYGDKFKGVSDKDYEKEAFCIASNTVDLYFEKIMDGLNLTKETENDKSCKKYFSDLSATQEFF